MGRGNLVADFLVGATLVGAFRLNRLKIRIAGKQCSNSSAEEKSYRQTLFPLNVWYTAQQEEKPTRSHLDERTGPKEPRTGN